MSTKLLDEYVALLKAEGANVCDTNSSSAMPSIGPSDVLIVVDMEIDFLPGGSLAVDEGDATVAPIRNLVSAFAARGAPVFFTRDYHPIDHCSFSTRGGPFNPHCVQGTHGATFAPELVDVAQPLLREGKVGVVYKGFCKDIDSFGSFPYSDAAVASGRVSSTPGATPGGCKSTCWTGAFCLFSSNSLNDMNAPPDVMAILDKVDFETAIRERVADKASARIFVCGLALDFCVIDTAINAREVAGFSDVSILMDCARCVHVPGGPFGSGFVSSPKEFADRTQKAGVKLIFSPTLHL